MCHFDEKCTRVDCTYMHTKPKPKPKSKQKANAAGGDAMDTFGSLFDMMHGMGNPTEVDCYSDAAKRAAVLDLKAFAVQRKGLFKACDLGKPSGAAGPKNFYEQFPQHKPLIQAVKLPALCAAFPQHLRYECSAVSGQFTVVAQGKQPIACQWGANCNRIQCWFLHPAPKPKPATKPKPKPKPAPKP